MLLFDGLFIRGWYGWLYLQNFEQEDRVSLVLPTGEEFMCTAKVIFDSYQQENEGIAHFSHLTALL